MEELSVDSRTSKPVLKELTIPFPNKKWFSHKFLMTVCLTAIALFISDVLEGEVNVTLFRNCFCQTVLVVVVLIILGFWSLNCINKVIFYQDSFVVYRKSILYRAAKDVFYTYGLEVIDRRQEKHWIVFRNRRGYSQWFSYKDGWTDEQLDQIMECLKQYDGVRFVQDKKRFRRL